MRPALLTTSLCWLLAAAATLQAGEDALPAQVRKIRVQPDLAPDCTSLKSIVESVTRGCTSNDAKAIAIYNFFHLAHYHRGYPREPGGVPALKEITNYGWSLCGGQHSALSALWRQLGWGWRFLGWPGHTTVEAEYDGRWHYIDTFMKFYAWAPDGKGGRTIASQEDLAKDPAGLLHGGFIIDKGRNVAYVKDNPPVRDGKVNWMAPPFLNCGDTLESVAAGVKARKLSGSPEGWQGINHADGGYVTDVNLLPGHALTCTWDMVPDAWIWTPDAKAAPVHTCPGHKDTRNDPGYGLVLEPYISAKPARSYANGMLTFAPDFAGKELQGFVSAENVALAGKVLAPIDAAKPGVLVFQLASPYNMTRASGTIDGPAKVEISSDTGKSWSEVDAKDFSAAVKGRLAVLVRLTVQGQVKGLRFEAIVQNNAGSLPYLSPGRNNVTVTVEEAAKLGGNSLVVTYAYRLGSRTKSCEQLCEQGKEVAKGNNASWSETVTYARKTLTAKDLPASFTIDCPTPKGQHPVYPRMLFMRREIIAPGATPLPLPDGAVEAKPATAEELPTLPNPFLVGTELPQQEKARAVRTIELPMTYLQFCDAKGAVAASGTLRWPKSPEESDKVLATAAFIAGDLTTLPAKDIAAARLCVPVLSGHNKAPGQLGVVILKTAAVKGTAVDFTELADASGSGQVPKQPAETAVYKPAKVVPIDITNQIRAIARKEVAFNGLAVRMVPNRAVDEGYTVRCELSPTDKIVMQVDVYADTP